MLTRDQIEAKGARRVAVLTVPKVGEVNAQTLEATDYAGYESEWFNSDGSFNRPAYLRRKPHLIVLTMLNPDGSRMWKPEDRELVANLGPQVVEPLFDVLEDFCGLRISKEAAVQLEKKSDAPPAPST